MKHLIICREYPPAPGGGIGTYVFHISRLLAESGETVHVISQLCEVSEKKREEMFHGRLIVHRIPFAVWTSSGRKLSPAVKSKEAKGLFESSFYPQCFSWQAGLLAESLVEQEGIDIIEAQEYEAPLYYFQLRRALGFGPKRHPPCFVHLHSPTEFIARYNDQSIGLPAVQTAKRIEDYTIAAADALLCPSRYLARQVESHYGLAENTVWVIPYPVGDGAMLARDKDTWEQGTICYVGRLERRKGVIEWIDAAVAVAHEYPTAHFEFIGINILGIDRMSGGEVVERRIPDDVRMRFHFRGQANRSSLPQFLVKARIAVIPSRWENFPNTCIEAMSSGIPVIASPEGGMAEMIQDGQTGWLAANARSEGLAESLKRALATPPMRLAEMGNQASSDIRRMCDNRKILQNHLDFRSRIVRQGCVSSLRLPVNLPWTKRPLSDERVHRTPQNRGEKGIAIVVTCFNTGQFLDACLHGLKRQTQQPAAVVVVDDISTEEQTLEALGKARQEGWEVIQKKKGNLAPAKNVGIEEILNGKPGPLGFAFLNASDRLQPGFVAACESVLQHCPEVGLVSCWVSHSNAGVWVKPCPSFPYQWLSNDAAHFSVIRTEALREAGNFHPEMSHGYENWELFTAVMAAGWVAVTVPEILGDHWHVEDPVQYKRDGRVFGEMRRKILERFPELFIRDAKDIVLLSVSDMASFQNGNGISFRNNLAMARKIFRSPGRTGVQVLKKVKDKILG